MDSVKRNYKLIAYFVSKNEKVRFHLFNNISIKSSFYKRDQVELCRETNILYCYVPRDHVEFCISLVHL